MIPELPASFHNQNGPGVILIPAVPLAAPAPAVMLMRVGTDETGPREAPNGLLLRADVHTPFDLHPIRVHPRTRKIFAAEALKKGSCAKRIAGQLRLPEKPEDRPGVGALQQRREASGGAGAQKEKGCFSRRRRWPRKT